jgi:hypothetical protein
MKRVANQTIGHLRALAADHCVKATRRFKAIECLAAVSGVYWVKETQHLSGPPVPADRARRSVRRLLKALLNDKKSYRPRWLESAVRERLLFISGVDVGAKTWRATPTPAPVAQVEAKQEPVNEHVNEIDEFLKQHGVK